ncbi:MAG: DUF5062 family protein, partial [Pseudomonadota bacterium]
MAKKRSNEAALLNEALRLVMEDAVKRKIVEFEATDSKNLKIEYAYRLLVHDKKIVPLAADQVTMPNIKHRLAMWAKHELP